MTKKIKTAFLYTGPHHGHRTFAESVNAVFISDKVEGFIIPNVSRFLQTFRGLGKIPKDTEVLICEGGSSIFKGALWKTLNPKKKLVLIVDEPKLYYVQKMNSLKKRLYYSALEKFDLFVPTTDFAQSFVPKHLQKKCVQAPMSIEVSRFERIKPNLASKNLAYVGGLIPLKGLDHMVDIMNGLKKEFPETKLVLVGDGPLRQKMEGIEGVECKGFSKEPEEFLKNASIYLQLSEYDAAGAAVLEAMTAGLIPIVYPTVGVCTEVAKIDEKLVVKSPEEAVQKIIKVWKDRKKLAADSKSAKKIGKRFTKEYAKKLFRKAIQTMFKKK
ncbi:MAG: glycosyltransferase family 4 protein [Candidatus Diapherotrites archaeon]|nr:glycosyltransferase family 4 protein [Candidatus Diapherotrites archaeon]